MRSLHRGADTDKAKALDTKAELSLACHDASMELLVRRCNMMQEVAQLQAPGRLRKNLEH